VVINQGGTSSGKTYAILQVILLRRIKQPGVTTIVGQDIPNLKKGALRDMERILADTPQLQAYVESYNKTDRTYQLINGSIIEFSSFKDEQDAKSGKRDDAFFNEMNGIPYGVYKQIAMRTNDRIFGDYNPTTSFWAHEKLMGQPEVVFYYSNFTHNPFADPQIIKHVRTYKERDPESWLVYGLGKTGNIKGLIFRNVQWVPSFPAHAKKVCYGLDFGFSNDPTALVRLGELHGEIYGEQLIYSLGLTNQDIAAKMGELRIPKSAEIFADSAEPKSIAEIKAEGYNVKPAAKGRDSVNHGISTMKQFNWNITADSTDWKREQANYKWQEKDGVALNKPVDTFNHCWDAARYAMTMKWGNITKRTPQIL